MRTTVHLVTARDGATLRPLMRRCWTRGFAASPWAKELPGVDLDAVPRPAASCSRASRARARELGERCSAERFPGDDAAVARATP